MSEPLAATIAFRPHIDRCSNAGAASWMCPAESLSGTGATKVGVVQPMVDDVPIYLVENGELEAVEQALVQARVRGILQELKFVPNSYVEEGTELFVIEQKEYITQVKAAQANLNSAKAGLETAEAAVGVAKARIAATEASIKVSQTEYERIKGLADSKSVSRRELDAAVAKLETSIAENQGAIAAKIASEAEVSNARAKLEQAEADLVQAELDLEWTVVKAPISGRITRTLVKRGNLVENGTPLIEIVKNDPIWANFNINERFLLNIDRESKRRNTEPADLSSIKVQLQRSGDVGFPFEGHLDYADPKVDQDTATLTVRAVFENPPENENTLMPGLFVRVRANRGVRKCLVDPRTGD